MWKIISDSVRRYRTTRVLLIVYLEIFARASLRESNKMSRYFLRLLIVERQLSNYRCPIDSGRKIVLVCEGIRSQTYQKRSFYLAWSKD